MQALPSQASPQKYSAVLLLCLGRSTPSWGILAGLSASPPVPTALTDKRLFGHRSRPSNRLAVDPYVAVVVLTTVAVTALAVPLRVRMGFDALAET